MISEGKVNTVARQEHQSLEIEAILFSKSLQYWLTCVLRDV